MKEEYTTIVSGNGLSYEELRRIEAKQRGEYAKEENRDKRREEFNIFLKTIGFNKKRNIKERIENEEPIARIEF